MKPRLRRIRFRVGIDTGGTFTDLVAIGAGGSRGAGPTDGAGRTFVVKVPSTPRDPEQGVRHALRELARRLALEAPAVRAGARPQLEIVHGTTVATNAVLEGRGARVVLVTNAGFEDLIEIGRQARPDLYDLSPLRPPALVARGDRLGLAERTLHTGARIVRPGAGALRQLLAAVKRRRPEALAIGLLHSYANPAAEIEVERALAPLALPISRSSAIAPLFREYERLSTTVANAALAPLCKRYLERLARALPRTQLFILQSNGGWTSARQAARTPVRFVLSGPAGGVAAAARRLATRRATLRGRGAGGAAGASGVVSLDMGGTSTDVGLVLGEPRRTDVVDLAGRPLLVDALEIHSIGAGGGSVLWVDDGGALRAGPRSAGVDPGPACYGRGTEPCVSDAHLLLGRLPVRGRLGGAIELDVARSRAAFAPLARRLKCTPLAVAAAALEVVDAAMAKAIAAITLERGHDPRELSLFAFGGAGGLHACRLARRLEMRGALVPPLPGATSAWGMATGDARHSLSQGIVRRVDRVGMEELARVAAALARRARRELARDLGADAVRSGAAIRTELRAACRHVGQSFELDIPFTPDLATLAAAFRRAHRERYGFELADVPVECVALRASAVQPSRFHEGAARRAPARTPRARSAAAAIGDCTPVRFAGAAAPVATPIVARDRLLPGMRMRGPAIVVEATATTVVEPGFSLAVDAGGTLILTRDA
jgi:N-methylhydantoinase A